jgi:hypothetical protein
MFKEKSASPNSLVNQKNKIEVNDFLKFIDMN